MQQTPWTVRSVDWPVPTKMTLTLIAKDIGKSSSYFENSASAGGRLAEPIRPVMPPMPNTQRPLDWRVRQPNETELKRLFRSSESNRRGTVTGSALSSSLEIDS